MTTDAQEPSTNDETERGTMPPSVLDADAVLALLVRVANAAGAGMSVTLSISGTLVSGYLIARNVFFERSAQLLGGVNEHAEVGKAFAEHFTKEAAKHESMVDTPIEYFHLQDVVYGINSRNPRRFALFRGRLSSVDGFYFGTSSEGQDLL